MEKENVVELATEKEIMEMYEQEMQEEQEWKKSLGEDSNASSSRDA